MDGLIDRSHGHARHRRKNNGQIRGMSKVSTRSGKAG